MSETMQLVFEIIGTIAFAVSGAMVGVEKEMDILGISILGLTTAVGGGVIRDLILGVTPPATFQNPIYAVIAIITSIIVFTPYVQRIFERNPIYYENNIFLLFFVGVVTGVGGGVMRDMMAGDRPYIFVKHFYATASLIGAGCCIVVWNIFGQAMAMLVGTIVVVVLRFMAAKFRWSLPKAK